MQLQTFHMEGVCEYLMNTNATAQMVTTTQVGCSRTNWKKLYEELIPMHREAVDKCNDARRQLSYEQEQVGILETELLATEKQLAAERKEKERWQDEYARKVTEHENTKGICDILNEQLAAEQNEHGRITANIAMQVQTKAHQITELKDLLKKIQPFAKAWAMEEICDEIEEAIRIPPRRST